MIHHKIEPMYEYINGNFQYRKWNLNKQEEEKKKSERTRSRSEREYTNVFFFLLSYQSAEQFTIWNNNIFFFVCFVMACKFHYVYRYKLIVIELQFYKAKHTNHSILLVHIILKYLLHSIYRDIRIKNTRQVTFWKMKEKKKKRKWN